MSSVLQKQCTRSLAEQSHWMVDQQALTAPLVSALQF